MDTSTLTSGSDDVDQSMDSSSSASMIKVSAAAWILRCKNSINFLRVQWRISSSTAPSIFNDQALGLFVA